MQQRERERGRVVGGTKKRKNIAQARLGMYSEWDYGAPSQKGHTSRLSQVSVSLQHKSTLNLLCDPFFPPQQNHFPKIPMLKSIIRLQSPNSFHIILL